MYARFSSLLSVAALAAVAAAVPNGLEARGGTSECNTGSNYCCDSVQSPTNESVTELAGLLGINLSGVTGLVGLTCTSIVGEDSCAEQPACCTGDSFSGLIVLGCDPISL